MPHTGGHTEDGRHSDQDALRVPFWIVLAGVGAGAFWALAGVTVGAALARRRDGGGPRVPGGPGGPGGSPRWQGPPRAAGRR